MAAEAEEVEEEVANTQYKVVDTTLVQVSRCPDCPKPSLDSHLEYPITTLI